MPGSLPAGFTPWAPMAVPAGIPSCREGQVDGGPVSWNGGGGQSYVYVELQLRSGAPCQLSGHPDLQILDASGSRLGFTRVEDVWFGGHDTGPVLLDGRSAIGQFEFTLDGPGLCPAPDGIGTQLKMTIEAAGTLTVPLGAPHSSAIPLCVLEISQYMAAVPPSTR